MGAKKTEICPVSPLLYRVWGERRLESRATWVIVARP